MHPVEPPPPAPEPPARLDLGLPAGGRGAGGWSSRLDRWAADARVEEAARGRARERSLRRQAEEEGSVAGVLADLLEAEATVRMALRGGHVAVGRVAGVGADVVVLAAASPAVASPVLTVAALVAVCTLRSSPGQPAVTGDRTTRSPLRLDGVLAELAADREPVRVLTVDGGTVDGRLRSVGRDVVTLTSGPGSGARAGGGASYVARHAVAAVVVGVGGGAPATAAGPPSR